MVISLYSPKGCLRRQFSDQLLRHQPARSNPSHSRHCTGRSLWRHRLRNARLDQTRSARKVGTNSCRRHGDVEQNLGPQAERSAARQRLDREFTETLSAPGRLVTPEEFENIIIRQTGTGAVVRIKDIGRRARFAGLQLVRTAQRQTRRSDGRLPPAGRQPAQSRGNNLRDDGACQVALSA